MLIVLYIGVSVRRGQGNSGFFINNNKLLAVETYIKQQQRKKNSDKVIIYLEVERRQVEQRSTQKSVIKFI